MIIFASQFLFELLESQRCYIYLGLYWTNMFSSNWRTRFVGQDISAAVFVTHFAAYEIWILHLANMPFWQYFYWLYGLNSHNPFLFPCLCVTSLLKSFGHYFCFDIQQPQIFWTHLQTFSCRVLFMGLQKVIQSIYRYWNTWYKIVANHNYSVDWS